MGTMSGGSAMMRGWPSTVFVSLENAFMLFLDRAFVRLAPRLGAPLGPSSARAISSRRVAVQTGVPEAELAPPRKLDHGHTVGADGGLHGSPPIGWPQAAVTPHDLHTGGQALHIPLPWPWQRLVEVVHIEQESPFRPDANPPKFSRWASPQHWTRSPDTGVVARSAAIIAAAPL